MIEKLAETGERDINGDGIPVSRSQLSCLPASAVDSSGNLYVAEFHCHHLRRIDPNGFFTTIAEAEKQAYGGPATESPLGCHAALAVDWPGNLVVSDKGNHGVWRITPDSSIATVAGTGMAGCIGEGGAAAEASLHGQGQSSALESSASSRPLICSAFVLSPSVHSDGSAIAISNS